MKIMNGFRVLCIALLTLSLPALAEVEFQGFASFVGGATLDSDDTYNGYENKIEYDKNSVYGLQAVSRLGDGLTATGQIVARGSENYKPEFEWMYMTYNITPTLSAKFGRIRTPFYMLSEYLEVGYTYHWIRPPEELYAAQITNMDGASLLYNVPMGGIDAQFTLSLANRESYSEDPNLTTSDYKSIIATTAQFEMGDHSTKLIYVQGDLTFGATDISDLETAFNAVDPSFISDHVTIEAEQLVFAGFGFELNFEPVKVILEYSTLDFGDTIFLPEETRTLASVVYGFGESNVSYSWSSNLKESDASIADDTTNATLKGIATATLAGSDSDVTTHTVGVRHDFHDSAAFKVELISTEDSDKDTEATLVRFGVDMLF